MLLLQSWCKISDEKMQDSDAFYECVTQQTDRPMDTVYRRDASTYLKTCQFHSLIRESFEKTMAR